MAEDPIIRRAQQLAIKTLRRMALLRSRSYRRVFTPPAPRPDAPQTELAQFNAAARDREIVLADLRDFCCANTTTFSPDPYVAARRQGRREAWLRITQHLNLDEEKIQKLVELDDGL